MVLLWHCNTIRAWQREYRATPGQLLTVDPENSDIWSIWEHAKVGDREKIVAIAKAVVGKTGT